ncbi:MAG: hypothetical protein ACRDWS_13295 [Acidimicrobiia bacterium]
MSKVWDEIGATVHDASEHKGGIDQCSLGEVAQGVAQLGAPDPMVDHRVPALVEEHDGAQRLGGEEEGEELGSS